MKRAIFLFLSALLLCTTPAHAALTVGSNVPLFANYMCVQKGAQIKVWGKDDVGAHVQVTLDNGSTINGAQAIADSGGQWSTFLPAWTVYERELTLTVSDCLDYPTCSSHNTTITRSHIWSAEVGLCIGQSNQVQGLNTTEDALIANYNTFPAAQRVFHGQWNGADGAGNSVGQPAACFYVTTHLIDAMQVPVCGIVRSDNASYGYQWQVPKRPWYAPLDNPQVDCSGVGGFGPPSCSDADLSDNPNVSDVSYGQNFGSFLGCGSIAQCGGSGPAPNVAGFTVAWIFNWQYEADLPYPRTYGQQKFQQIRDYRAVWGYNVPWVEIGGMLGQGMLPGALPAVQPPWPTISGFKPTHRSAIWEGVIGGGHAMTGVVSTGDLPSAHNGVPWRNVHPVPKKPQADRAANWLLRVVYGLTTDVSSNRIPSWAGPTIAYAQSEGTGSQVRVHFVAGTNDGLRIRTSSTVTTLQGFALCDASWYCLWAHATIQGTDGVGEGRTVLLSHPGIPTPKYVEYNWGVESYIQSDSIDFYDAFYDFGNLENNDGFPGQPARLEAFPCS